MYLCLSRIISSQDTVGLFDELRDPWNCNTKLMRRPNPVSPREPWDRYYFEISAENFLPLSDLSIDLKYRDSNWNTHYYRPCLLDLPSSVILNNLISDTERIHWKPLTVNSSLPIMLLSFCTRPFFLRLPPISVEINITEPLPDLVNTCDRPPSPPIYTSASNPFSRNRTRFRLRNDVPPRRNNMSMDFSLPAIGPSIYTTRVTRSDLYIPPAGLGFLFPRSLFTRCAVDFAAPGWLSDPRLRPIVDRLRSGNVYIFLKGPSLRDYYVLSQNLPSPQNSHYCVTISDESQFATFISLYGVSDPRHRSLYKKIQGEIKQREIIRLSSSCNLYLLINKIPHDQHLMALSLAATPLELRNP